MEKETPELSVTLIKEVISELANFLEYNTAIQEEYILEHAKIIIANIDGYNLLEKETPVLNMKDKILPSTIQLIYVDNGTDMVHKSIDICLSGGHEAFSHHSFHYSVCITCKKAYTPYKRDMQ